MIGASRLLVRFIVRTRPFCRSSLDEDMISWFVGGVDDRARLMSVPSGEAGLFDISVLGCENSRDTTPMAGSSLAYAQQLRKNACKLLYLSHLRFPPMLIYLFSQLRICLSSLAPVSGYQKISN